MSGFTLPTSRHITQAYGAEFDDWDGDGIVDYPGGFYNSIGWDGHNGIDYGCGLGDPIYAVADGIVTWAAWAGNHWLLSGGGNAVLIEHPEYGVQTEYLHLSRFAVTNGRRVTKDQVIGYAGKTGAATGYHLHLGMLPLKGINLNNRARGRIDPTPWLYGNLNPDYAGGIAAMGTTTDTTEEEEDMGLTDEQAKTLAYIGSAQFKADIFAGTTGIEKDARDKFHQEALNTGVPWYGTDGKIPPEGQRRTTSLAVDLGYADTNRALHNSQIAAQAAKLDALASVIASTGTVSKEEILAQLDASVKDSFGRYQPVFVQKEDK